MKRQLLEMRVHGCLDLKSKKIDGSQIKDVWTIYSEELLQKIKENPEIIATMTLEGNKGLFCEYKKLDWDVDSENLFWYYTMLASRNDKMFVILEIAE